MPEEKLYKAEEVALFVGISVPTLNIWYRWKRNNPNHELAQLLPDFTQSSSRQTRYWKQSDCWKLIEFRQSIPQGRNGVMGSITQKYTKKEKKNGKN